MSDDLALVQTVDFFAPIIDDPYTFGRIAATNALSDVYAMGGEPLTALNIVAFPVGKLPLSVLTEILRGGQDATHAAGALLVGGHSIDDEEIKYGLAVTGRADPRRLLTNAGARVGEVLLLTKPIGTGILATALKQGRLDDESYDAMVASMTSLNAAASRAALELGARCATDVTGFGLLGHASHIARASDVTLRIRASNVPVLRGTREAFAAGATTGGARRNAEYLSPLVDWGETDEVTRALLVDPQTSGGLLIALYADQVDEFVARIPGTAVVGSVEARGAFPIVLEH